MSIKSDDKYSKQLTSIGLYLRELRINSNITQQELSEEFSIHHNTISRAENGANITLKTLLKLSTAFNQNASEILTIVDEI